MRPAQWLASTVQFENARIQYGAVRAVFGWVYAHEDARYIILGSPATTARLFRVTYRYPRTDVPNLPGRGSGLFAEIVYGTSDRIAQVDTRALDAMSGIIATADYGIVGTIDILPEAYAAMVKFA